MISFLIPTYNFDITELLLKLMESCKLCGCEYEVLAYDDASLIQRFQRINNFLNGLDNVTYKVLEKNIGRSAIRNLLVKEAKGDYLCFIDCDCVPKNKDFVSKYIEAIKDCDVVCGGTLYQPKEQIENKYYLHHKNGLLREQGKQHFTSDNFFIRKDVFLSVHFDETLKGYGHEDTIFGLELKQSGFNVKHIDNPVYHLGLKDNDKFLYDVYNAQKNLRILYDNPKYEKMLSDSPVVVAYNKLKKYHLTKLYSLTISLLTPLIKKQLHLKNPQLFLLDLYKLNCFITR